MKVVGIIQARLSSERLPGKVLKEIIGKPMIGHIWERVARSEKLDCLVLATSVDSSDDKLAEYAQENGMKLYRGSLNNVLERYYLCAKENHADIVVRLTGDNACVAPEIIDRAIDVFNELELDYLSYAKELPLGLSVEVFTFEALEKAYNNATTDICFEHVTPYLYKNGDMFKWVKYSDERLNNYSDIRLTVDTIEDFEVTSELYKEIGDNHFSYGTIVELIDKNLWWIKINKDIEQIKV